MLVSVLHRLLVWQLWTALLCNVPLAHDMFCMFVGFTMRSEFVTFVAASEAVRVRMHRENR